MTAFCGIIHLDGKPAERPPLEASLDYLIRIGPDERGIWLEGPAGFCQANLNPGYPGRATGVFAGNDRYMVIGDVRVDARKALLEALASNGKIGLDTASDLEIILHAWLTWGEQLTEKLVGDFSVLIWDRQGQSLFCLRDHMGIRPLFYALTGRTLIVSNVLNCIRNHFPISDELNHQAVVDFLVFGFNQAFDTTFFKHIRQLPPAHTMRVSEGNIQINQYWTLPIDDVLRYPKAYDYVEHFKELVDTSVKDRLPEGDIGIAMSGGLDSTSIAASAREFLAPNHRLTAFTLDIKSLWPGDQDTFHASLVADKLDLELVTQAVTSNDLFVPEQTDGWPLPEPSRDAFRPPLIALHRKMAVQNRVGLTGHGADSLLMPSAGHFSNLVRNSAWGRLTKEAFNYMRIYGRRPPLNIRGLLKKRYEVAPWRPAIPAWLPNELMAQSGVSERFAAMIKQRLDPLRSIHPERPEVYQDLCSAIWQNQLQRFDPQTTGQPITFNHPYFDVRLIRYVLAMPATPWFHSKELLRRSMKGRLPDSVRLRRKAMPSISPVSRGMAELTPSQRQNRLTNIPKFLDFVNVNILRQMADSVTSLKPEEADLIALPVALGNWLTVNQIQPQTFESVKKQTHE